MIEFLSFWISRLFDLGNLGVLEKSPVNTFNDYIFDISLFHWSKCTIECAIYSILILNSAQARGAYLRYHCVPKKHSLALSSLGRGLFYVVNVLPYFKIE